MCMFLTTALSNSLLVEMLIHDTDVKLLGNSFPLLVCLLKKYLKCLYNKDQLLITLSGLTAYNKAVCVIKGYLSTIHKPSNEVVLLHVPEVIDGDRNRECLVQRPN